MTYLYDILLNFNSDFYEFYEWEKSDGIFHIKKIPMYKVESLVLEDIFTKKIVLDSPIVYEILNKTEVFDNKKIKVIKYACLFTDGYRVIGVLLNDDFKIFKVSDLLLDEASDAISISKRCTLVNLAYHIVGTKKNYPLLTRGDIKIKKYLINEISNANRDKNQEKLEYLYFEYFRKTENDMDKIYQELLESLKSEVTENHLKLYELLKLCHQEKSYPI